ncbi:MAG: AAA family ATPase [Faecousia sp.]
MAAKIICVGREFGSGGSEVAARLGDILGLKVYEKELLTLACAYGGLPEERLKKSDERATNPYLYETVHEGSQDMCWGLPTSEALFQLQSHEILRLADQGSCIFVGRCADFVLKDSDLKLLRVFVCAPAEFRIQRKMREEGLSHLRAKSLVRKTDLQRMKYYSHYTGRTWGARENYDMYINTRETGIEKAVELIAARYQML